MKQKGVQIIHLHERFGPRSSMTRCPATTSIRVQELYIDGKWSLTIHDIGWLVAAFFASFASGVAIWLMWMHATYYHKPWEQRHIARILLMLPVYSVISVLSYVFYPWAMAYNTISSAYESVALCSFFLLLRTYLDPDVRGLKHDLRLRVITYWAWPLSYGFVKRWLHLTPMNGLTWYYAISFGISQYVILRPTLAVISILLEHLDVFCETSLSPVYGNFYIFVVQSVSVAVAMYCVVAFYLELKEEPALKKNKPLMKLTCIKLVIFMIFWQSIVLQLLTVAGIIKDRNEHWSARDIQTGLNALATCVEMAIFAVMHISAFTYKDYVPADKSKTCHRWRLIVDAFNVFDFVREFIQACKWVFHGRRRFDPDGFDVERDDAIYERLRASRMRQTTRDWCSVATIVPMVNKTAIPDLGLQLPTCKATSEESTSIFGQRSLKTELELVDENIEGPYPPPKLRVLQTRSRASSVATVSVSRTQNASDASASIVRESTSGREAFQALAASKRQLPKVDRILGI